MLAFQGNIAIEHFDCLASGKCFAKLHSKIINIAWRLGNIPIEHFDLFALLEILLFIVFIACRLGIIAKLHSKSIHIARRSEHIRIEHVYCLPSWKYI